MEATSCCHTVYAYNVITWIHHAVLVTMPVADISCHLAVPLPSRLALSITSGRTCSTIRDLALLGRPGPLEFNDNLKRHGHHLGLSMHHDSSRKEKGSFSFTPTNSQLRWMLVTAQGQSDLAATLDIVVCGVTEIAARARYALNTDCYRVHSRSRFLLILAFHEQAHFEVM